MKRRIVVLSALTMASMLLSACGGATPTAVRDLTATVVQPTAGTSDTAPTAVPAGSDRKVVVSSKDFTEEFLLGEMYALALENAGVPVERKLNLGGSDIAQAAMLKGGTDGGIDLYPEYTSTGLTVILRARYRSTIRLRFMMSLKKGYEEEFKFTWLDAAPMNDTQAFVITKAKSDGAWHQESRGYVRKGC